MTIETLQDAGRRWIEAWSKFDRAIEDLRRKLLSGTPGPLEREAFAERVATLEQARDAEIAAVRREANRQNAVDAADIQGRLDQDLGRPSEASIGQAWPTLRSVLDGGTPIREALTVRGMDRAAVEAARANYAAYVTSKNGPGALTSPEQQRKIEEGYRDIDAAELALLDPDVRAATVASRQRDGAEVAMNRAATYDGQRRAGWKPTNPAQTEIELAYGLASDLGVRAHEPGYRPHAEILDEVDPGWRAERDVNSNPELRSKLSGRPVGWRPAPEPAFQPPTPAGTGSESQS